MTRLEGLAFFEFRDGPWCTCMECMQVEAHDRAPARHDDDCDGRKPRTVVPHG